MRGSASPVKSSHASSAGGRFAAPASICDHGGSCIRSLLLKLSFSDHGKKTYSSELTFRSGPLAVAVCIVSQTPSGLYQHVSDGQRARFSNDLITALQHFNI
jgi:hypothetical protein